MAASRAPSSGSERASVGRLPLGTKAPMRNQIPRMTSAHGQYVAMRSPGAIPIDPVVLARSTEPTTIQATGHVHEHKPPYSPRRGMTAVTSMATPMRITNIGHAWLHGRSAARWTRKTIPRPISQVAPISGLVRVSDTVPPLVAERRGHVASTEGPTGMDGATIAARCGFPPAENVGDISMTTARDRPPEEATE